MYGLFDRYVYGQINKTSEGLAKNQKHSSASDNIDSTTETTMNTITEDVVERGENEVENSQNNGEIDTSEWYNGNTSYALKYWHTGLSQSEILLVEKWVRSAGMLETKKIVTNTYWYKGKLNGRDFFAIYSTEDANNPVIEYLARGREGNKELNSLLDVLEEIENEKRTRAVRKQTFADRVLIRDWVPNKFDLANNNDRLGGGSSSVGNASILQGKSSKLVGSKTFRFLIEDLLQREARITNKEKNFSLKDNEDSTITEVSYSLKDKWHTDLTKSQLKMVDGWLRKAGTPEAKRIADTAYWYKGRIGGDDLFVIYSTEDSAGPTILYEIKGKKAIPELNILLRRLEEYEYGERERAVGKSQTINTVLSGSWMQQTNGIQNRTTLNRGTSNKNVGILQGQSQGNASRALWNVIDNLLGKRGEIIPEQFKNKDFSLKDDIDVSPQRTKDYLDTVEDVQKGKKGAVERLAKYVDDGMITTDAYKKLIEKYGAIPAGEKPSRDVQVPRKTSKDKKVSQTVRTILEAKATPDEAVPTIEKMVVDGVFSYDNLSCKTKAGLCSYIALLRLISI